MKITTVVHVNDPFDVYIGRAVPRRGLKASAFANPFVIGRDGDRAEVIKKYRVWLRARPELVEQVKALKGKRLGCWCAPEACHGDVPAAVKGLRRMRLR